ncbi:MAG TPA: capsule assembly Wzi family protein, partial [Terriglobia bacterium]|nr:capsule assembly Wzi family protein [Terriglobia bacterium]
DRLVDRQTARTYEAAQQECPAPWNDAGGQRAALESASLRFTSIGGAPLTDGYHFGQTIVDDFGRPYGEGANWIAGISGRGVLGPLGVYLRGEYQRAASRPPLSEEARQWIARADGVPVPAAEPEKATERFRLLEAYASFNFHNWMVSFGKQNLWWGPGRGGSLLFSSNAEPIPMFRINRVLPFKFPLFLKWLGPVRAEFFFGQLAGHQHIRTQLGRPVDPQPFLHGQKINFKPTPNLEIGFSRTAIYGGPGLPLTPEGIWRTLFSYGNSFGPADPGDRRSGFDVAYRVPGLRQWLLVYLDAFAEDEPSAIAHPHRAAMHPGIYLPQLPGLPNWDFRAEGAFTDLPDGLAFPGFYYANVRYLDGYTNRGNLLGHWVGRQGHGMQFSSTYWRGPRDKVQFGYRRAMVSGDFLPGGGRIDDYTVRMDWLVRPNLGFSASVQYERWNIPVLSAGKESNVLTSVQLTLWPD